MQDEPITLCECSGTEDLSSLLGEFTVRFDGPGVRAFYAGISEEGFDFSASEAEATRLTGVEAKRVAIAIANVQIDWSGGMMAGQPGCTVAVLDESGREQLAIRAASDR